MGSAVGPMYATIFISIQFLGGVYVVDLLVGETPGVMGYLPGPDAREYDDGVVTKNNSSLCLKT